MNGRVLTTHPMQTYLATSAFVGSSALEVMNGFDPSNTTVFVGSLSDPTITEEDLENLFSTFGQHSDRYCSYLVGVLVNRPLLPPPSN
mmetsp:Transcript_933/g.1898  ORF Transcript_933/g.1898 Transcript_933/m.1898 type:complete len:88 (-) Transcript_933:1039-1302(-)